MRYFCSPHHQDSALHPFIAQLERAAGFEREDTPEVKVDKLAILAPASPGDGALLAELLSLPTEGRFPPLQLSRAPRPARRAGGAPAGAASGHFPTRVSTAVDRAGTRHGPCPQSAQPA